MDPYKWILKKLQEEKRKRNSVDEVKTPQGASKPLLSPKFGGISPFTCYCYKKTANKDC
jgi:hypothetical protein